MKIHALHGKSYLIIPSELLVNPAKDYPKSVAIIASRSMS